MVVTTTAISFILLGLGLGICGWRFLRAFKITGGDSRIGFLLSIFFLIFAGTNLILGLGSLFFAKTPAALFGAMVFTNGLLATLSILGVYIVYHIFSPGTPTFFPMAILTILGISAVAATIAFHPQPFLTPRNSVDWGAKFPFSLVMLYLLSLSIGSALYIFTRLFLEAKNREIKFLSLTIAILALAGVIQALLQYAVFGNSVVDIRTKIQDVILGLIGVGFMITLLAVPAIKNKFKDKAK